MTERRIPDRAWLALSTLAAVGLAFLLAHLTSFSTGDWLLFLAAPAPWLFVLRYALVRWWGTVSGRAIMLKSVGTGLFLTLAVAGVLNANDYPGRDAVRVVVYAFLFASQWYLTTLLWRIQHDAQEPLAASLTHEDRERTDA